MQQLDKTSTRPRHSGTSFAHCADINSALARPRIVLYMYVLCTLLVSQGLPTRESGQRFRDLRRMILSACIAALGLKSQPLARIASVQPPSPMQISKGPVPQTN